MKLDRKAALLFLISFSLYLSLSLLVVFLLPENSSETLQYLFYALGVSIPAFLLPAIFFRSKNDFAPFRFPPFTHVLLALVLGLGCIFLNNALVNLILALTYNVEFNSMAVDVENTVNNSNVWVMLVSVALIPAVSEEYLMRGALLETWRRGRKPAVPAILTALLFALLHIAPGYLPVYFAMGMLFAIVFLITRNVWMTVIIHFINNMLSVVTSAFEIGGSSTAEATQFTYVEGFVFLSAIAAALIVPILFALRSSCMRRKIGAYAESGEAGEPAGSGINRLCLNSDGLSVSYAADTSGKNVEAEPVKAESEQPRSLFKEPLIWVALGLLIMFNLVSGLIEFGVISID